jgi:hypothetical protein
MKMGKTVPAAAAKLRTTPFEKLTRVLMRFDMISTVYETILATIGGKAAAVFMFL